jgi:flagellar biosynthetic protein FliO
MAEVMENGGRHAAAVGSPMSFSYVVQIFISFLVVIGFILLMAWLLRRTGRLGHGDGQIIKIVSSISLGMREKIMVVEVGTEHIVIGVAPGQIRTLHILEGEMEAKRKLDVKDNSDRRGFRQLIEKFSKQ